VVVAGWGIVGLLRGSGVAADGVRRAIGPYNHPNNLAFFIERATLLTAIPAFFHPRYRRIGIALLVIGGVAVLATFSRGALIGLSAGAVVALWLIGRLRAIAGVAAALVAAGGVLALLAGERLFDSGGEGSEPSRFVIWEGAERILRDFPLTGIGPDQFYVMYGLRYIEPVGWPERYTAHAHNIFLDFWLWFGLAGLAFAVVACAWVAWRTIRLQRIVVTQGTIKALPIAGAAALAAGLTHGLIDHGFLLPDLAVLTWFAVALLIAPAAETAR
ncbi:MAG: O-antigen ligase family protein, partial [Thermomicrobiales bacterium]|nr:O-antigen ligase family protein [Thermomicrobiales bacterium]